MAFEELERLGKRAGRIINRRLIVLLLAYSGGVLIGWDTCIDIRGEWTWYFYVGFILAVLASMLSIKFFPSGLD